jgi:high affinity Mn2+ porin
MIWSGFYAGGHLGVAWGNSNWTASTSAAPAPSVSGSFGLFRPLNAFDETGSFLAGLQVGFNYVFPNRFIVGAEIDASFPSFLNPGGISIGGTSTLFAPSIGAETFSETMLSSGTVRGRIGYAPGNWLFYATGGLAWTYDQMTLTQLASGGTAMPFLWRFGWVAGAGVEVPVAPHWTARLEYLFTDYGISSVTFPATGQRFTSDFALQEPV